MRISELISKLKSNRQHYWNKWKLKPIELSNIKKVLVVSDTHNNYLALENVIELEKPDIIIHAGDHEYDPDFLKNNNIIFVEGNNDYFGPKELILSINNLKIALIHGHKQYHPFHWHTKLENYFQDENVDLIIYGHSHKEVLDKQKRPWILNPGSIAIPRNKSLTRTYAIIEFDSTNNPIIYFKTTN